MILTVATSQADQGGSMTSMFTPMAAVLAAAVLLSTTACGSDSSTGDSGAAPGEKVELIYWSWAQHGKGRR
jgi:ABC-type glycerol-3-phosphate transport system substrate-binding protein